MKHTCVFLYFFRHQKFVRGIIFNILKSNKVETPSREKLDNKVDDSTMKSLNI